MGSSFRVEQSETMEKLFKAEHTQTNPKWGEPGSYAFDGYIPRGDYGQKPKMNVRIDILKMLPGGFADVVGQAVIAPDGSFKMPPAPKKAMGL